MDAHLIVMAHHDQTLIPKLPKGLGDGTTGKERKNPGKITIRHPHPKTTIIIVDALPLPLPAKVIKPIIDSRRGNTQLPDHPILKQIRYQDQTSSMNELKRLRL